MPRFLALLALMLVLKPGAAAAEQVPEGQWPLDPRPQVAQGFDPPDVPWDRGHRGVDLLGRLGQRVLASLPGRVSFAGRIAGVGVVVVDHGGTRTTYQPVTPAVARGERVAAGAVLGSLAWVGSHCGARPCLHWGWRRGDRYLDPLLLVDAAPQPVRLLPPDAVGSVGTVGNAPSGSGAVDQRVPLLSVRLQLPPLAQALPLGVLLAPIR